MEEFHINIKLIKNKIVHVLFKIIKQQINEQIFLLLLRFEIQYLYIII